MNDHEQPVSSDAASPQPGGVTLNTTCFMGPISQDEPAESYGAANALAEHVLDRYPQPTEESANVVRSFCATVVMASEVFARKQADYGCGNISSFGELGVLMRVTDKVARLTHLAGRSALNEPVADSWLDIAVYGFIALMVRSGRWPRCQDKHRLDHVDAAQTSAALAAVELSRDLLRAIVTLNPERRAEDWNVALGVGVSESSMARAFSDRPITIDAFLGMAQQLTLTVDKAKVDALVGLVKSIQSRFVWGSD